MVDIRLRNHTHTNQPSQQQRFRKPQTTKVRDENPIVIPIAEKKKCSVIVCKTELMFKFCHRTAAY